VNRKKVRFQAIQNTFWKHSTTILVN